jgi:hypothetical protein
LFAVLSFAPLYLLGIGILSAHPALRARSRSEESDGHRSQAALLSGVLAIGILVNYVLVLGFESLRAALAVGCVLALLGLLLGLRTFLKRRGQQPFPFSRSWVWSLPLAYIVALYGVLILTRPLTHWDARSIWFFHAKIIYFQGALTEQSGWSELLDAHADYPKLLQTLAAQVACVCGYWNEFLPKAALLVLLVPAAAGYFAFFKRPISWVFLISMAFFSTYTEIWNGYADSYFALYAGLAILALGRWFDSRRPHDLLLGLAALGIVSCLKNEGSLFLVCTAVAFAAVGLLGWMKRKDRPPGSIDWLSLTYLMVVMLAGLTIWLVKKKAWGLHGDLNLSGRYLAEAWGRLTDGESFSLIVKNLFQTQELTYALIPLAMGIIAARVFRIRIPKTAWLPFSTATLYLFGIVLVYLGTPYELSWHLITSSGRTVLPIFVTLSVATFLVMDAMEDARADDLQVTGEGP